MFYIIMVYNLVSISISFRFSYVPAALQTGNKYNYGILTFWYVPIQQSYQYNANTKWKMIDLIRENRASNEYIVTTWKHQFSVLPFAFFSSLLLTELSYGYSQFDYQYVMKGAKQVAVSSNIIMWKSVPC